MSHLNPEPPNEANTNTVIGQGSSDTASVEYNTSVTTSSIKLKDADSDIVELKVSNATTSYELTLPSVSPTKLQCFYNSSTTEWKTPFTVSGGYPSSSSLETFTVSITPNDKLFIEAPTINSSLTHYSNDTYGEYNGILQVRQSGFPPVTSGEGVITLSTNRVNNFTSTTEAVGVAYGKARVLNNISAVIGTTNITITLNDEPSDRHYLRINIIYKI